MGTILLACDDIGLQTILAAEIEGQCHSVLVATTGQELLGLVPTTQPDMVMLTSSLPVFNGLETARLLRQNPDIPPRLPIVLVGADTADPRTAEQAGITETLSATHTTADVADLLTRHLQPTAFPG